MSDHHPWETLPHHYPEADSEGETIERLAGVFIDVYAAAPTTLFRGLGAKRIQRDVLHRHSMETVWIVALVSRVPFDLKECGGWTREVSREVVATFSAGWLSPTGEPKQPTSGLEDGLQKAIAIAHRHPLAARALPRLWRDIIRLHPSRAHCAGESSRDNHLF